MALGLRSAWVRQAGWTGVGSVARFDGVLATLTGLRDDTLNVAFVEGSPPDPAAALRETDAWFTAQGLRIGLDLDRGRDPDLERAAAVFGLRTVVSRPAMARPTGGDLPAGGGAPDVEVRRVRYVADLERARAVQVKVFHLAADAARDFLPVGLLDEPGYRLFLALAGGEPAGTAGVHLDHGAAGIFGVATVPSLRRRGVGTAVTARCLAEAAGAGCDLAWLQTTPEGHPLYERMGFSVVSDWDVWTR